jgi:predicted GNAT superfamily acetyltransferase
MSTIEPPPSTDVAADHHEPDEHTTEIRQLHDADEMVEAAHVFQQVWGSVNAIVPIEMLMAFAHSGGYVSAAYDVSGAHERVVGASVAFLARHEGRPALHSHITGLLPGARATGLGRAMKHHQYRWAAEQGIEWIVWTFDPLVRRNAWFNIAVLGAEVAAYLPAFYGTMTDAINAGDESDRLLAAWAVDPGGEPPTAVRDGHDVAAPATTIPTPVDVVALRRTDPAAATRWRLDTRSAFTAAFARRERVAGFTRDGDYLLTTAGGGA